MARWWRSDVILLAPRFLSQTSRNPGLLDQEWLTGCAARRFHSTFAIVLDLVATAMCYQGGEQQRCMCHFASRLPRDQIGLAEHQKLRP